MGGKKKGLSYEEKRQKILEIFYKRKEVFNLKEIESLGSKAGVVFNTIKDILQSLVDDNLVDSDKIGAGKYFWALPSKVSEQKCQRVEDLESELDHLKTSNKVASQQIINELEGKEDSEERTEALSTLRELQDKCKALEEESVLLRKCSKNYYEECLKESDEIIRKGNIWNDNIWGMAKWMTKTNPSMTKAAINREFGIPEDLDDFT